MSAELAFHFPRTFSLENNLIMPLRRSYGYLYTDLLSIGLGASWEQESEFTDFFLIPQATKSHTKE